MLSRVLMLRPAATALMRNQGQRRQLIHTPQRFFRPGVVNPYRHDPTPLSEQESAQQEAKPVWDRVFDHSKYMHHEGPLKLSTGIAFLDVEPFPRMKLMKLYHLCLQELKDVPDEYGYKFLCQELTRFRMTIVDENASIRAIEEKIAAGLVEELIFQAHNEIKLLKVVKSWKPWEWLATRDAGGKEQMQDMLNFTRGNPFPATFERFEDAHHSAVPRRPSAALHPEDK